ncbi:ATP-dependent bile acid permease [Diutina catenulata]
MSCRFWDHDDLTACGRNWLANYPPAVVAGVLAASLIIFKWRDSRSIKLDSDAGTASPAANHVTEAHYDLTRLADTEGDVVEVVPGTADRFRVAAEFVGVVSAIALAVMAPTTVTADVVLGAVLLVLLTLRACKLAYVWPVSVAGYLLWWPSLLVLAYSEVVRGSAGYYVAMTAIVTVLIVVVVTTGVPDAPASVYVPRNGATPSPEPISSLYSIFTYSWVNPMLATASKHTLRLHEVWGLRGYDYAFPVLLKFHEIKRFSFTFKLLYHFRDLLAEQTVWAVICAVVVFVPSVLLQRVLEYVEDPKSRSASVAWVYIVLMAVAKVVTSMASGRSLFIGRRMCIRTKAIIIGEVYAKALRRKMSVATDEEGQGPADLGAVINLMAVDAFMVAEVSSYLFRLVESATMIVICVALLYRLIGWSAFVGALTIIALIPVQYWAAEWTARLSKKLLKATDQRIQKLNETFQAIRIVKFFAWESRVYDAIMEVRERELKWLRVRYLARVAGSVVWFVTPTLVTLTSFYCYTIVAGNRLTAPVAFVALTLFNILRNPLEFIADIVSDLVQSKVSLDRVARFLAEPESAKYQQLQDDGSVGFRNATFAWNAKGDDFRLRDLDVSFKLGELNVVVGPTGSGKTSMLLALLGEMDLIQGSVHLPGSAPRAELTIDPTTGLTASVAYCAQQPWLLNDTIRNNILFAAPYNPERYAKVLDACGLTRDLEIFAGGDATEIGEKGIALSGGQKQRVSLARAVYSNSNTVLLDDCLSAVDAHTAQWIYHQCLAGPLMAGRTCVLVSHNVALSVSDASWVVAVDNGRVIAQGTPAQMVAEGHLGDDELVQSSVASVRSSATDLTASVASNEPRKPKQSKPIQTPEIQNGDDEAGKLVEQEATAEGTVSFDVYKGYAKYVGGSLLWTGLVSLFLISQGLLMLQAWWLRDWANSNPVAALVARAFATNTHGVIYYISIYGALGLLYSAMATLRVAASFFSGMIASNRMFTEVLQRVLHARVRFFDKTPIGRIMNRFSKDVQMLDQVLSGPCELWFICFVQSATTLIFIVAIVPGFLVFAIAISFMYYLMGHYYLMLSRELKRLESITKSPIHQHFGETLTGVATIRAYGVATRFMQENLAKIDTNNGPFWYLWMANRWLAMRIAVAGALVTLFTGIFTMWSVGRLDAGLAGIIMSYAISFSESVFWIVRASADVEMGMNSVERMQEYLEVDQEPPYELPDNKPPAQWPQEGRIDVRDLSLRYAKHLPQVIKNVSFMVEPRHKVGIVGRTGAGKSTIITALFRFLDPETGSITIDGVDITSIGLRDLRSALTIIPQDPTLFTGSIRSNLDPFSEYSDTQMFEALRRVNLIGANESRQATPDPSASLDENINKFLRLDNPITEGGGNLSQGERQLVCLARSLLKNPKVMLLDEATSSIDYNSDAMIQRTIREEFGNSTILTIAHRLRTIIDYDKILVLDAGEVAEYDDPYTLISNKESQFFRLCENSGELDSLVRLAKEAHKAKQK